MAFKMKGSPAKMGGIKGTSGHASALKQHAEASALKQAEASALKEGTDWWDKVKAAGGALYDNVGKVHGHGNSNSFSSNVAKSYGEKKKEYRKEAKESSNKMKSPMEQKKELNLKTIKEGFEGTDTEKVVKGVKKIAGKVKKFRKSLKPTKETKVTSDGDKTTATTTKSKNRLFGGKKTTTTSTSRDKEGVDYVRGTETQLTTRRGGGKKKAVTFTGDGKKVITRFKKDGTIKRVKVKKDSKHRTRTSAKERAAIQKAEK